MTSFIHRGLLTGFLLASCFIASTFSPFVYNSAQTNSSGCCQDAEFGFLGYLIGFGGGSVVEANTLTLSGLLLLSRPLCFFPYDPFCGLFNKTKARNGVNYAGPTYNFCWNTIISADSSTQACSQYCFPGRRMTAWHATFCNPGGWSCSLLEIKTPQRPQWPSL